MALINLGTKNGGLPFCLPIDLATESIAIIARKGAGKSYTARVISEDLLNNHIQTVVIDPLDVWWGLRLSADGKREGANVIIFGGSHADLPLTEHLGKTLADLIVDHGISAVLVIGDDFPLPPPGEQLVHYWMSQLGKAERMALDELWRVYPNTLTKEALAQQIDYQSTGGGFNNALSKLRTLELIVGRSDLSVNAAIAGDS